MRRFYTAVVQLRKPILVVFLLATAVCALLQNLVSVNYDINDYLPVDSPSSVALDRMEEEFDGGIPNARVMIRDVTIPEALAYKEQLKQVEGVTDVLWLDDSVDVAVPLAMQDPDTVETYYKDGAALFTVTMEEDLRIPAVAEIRDLIGPDNAISGSAVSTADAATSTVSEVQKIAIFAVLFVLLVLALTTDCWLEPLVIMAGMGVAILINGGTNLMFGEISFVTSAAGSILQLAVSLDYSVFLLHRFEDCLLEESDPKRAMVSALCKSTSSIASSGLTTVIGFLALAFMRFQLGPDLGLALAKGVAISLLTVFLFMPALILATNRLRKQTQHRSLVPDFHGFGRVVTKLMIPFTLLFFLILVPSYLASNSNRFYYGSSHIFGPETQLGMDVDAIEEVFGKGDTYVLMVPRGDLAVEQELSDQLHTLPQIKSILSYVDTVGLTIPTEFVPEDSLSQLMSDHYSRMVLTVEADYEGADTFALVEQIRAIAQTYYPDAYYLAGEGVSTYDLMDTITADMPVVNGIAIGAVFLVLLLTMKAVVLPVLLVFSIEAAIWINLAVPYFQDITLFYIAYLIINSVQLGATVDYAILLTDRYREFRTVLGVADKKQAMIQTISVVMVSVLTSASALTVAGVLMGYISTHGVLSQLGILLARGTLCSLAIVLFVLPGLLTLFDRVAIPRKGRKHTLLTLSKEVTP